ncbi:MAG: hypothetical protein HQL87_16425 [Magnetococcales bacterium]|nr:hypothetical protein [Magnetococcales bacterium]
MPIQRQLVEVTNRQVMIELPASFVNHRVELIVCTMDDEAASQTKRRRPHPEIAGKGRTLGDLVGPIVDGEAWECLQ